MKFQQRIAEAGSTLTPAESRIAEKLLLDPTPVAFGSVAEVAGEMGLSAPTVVRFATKLGYGGYRELQHSVRETLFRDLRPVDRLQAGDSTHGWPEAKQRALDLLASAYDSVSKEEIEELADRIASARKHVWVIATQTLSVAHLLAHSLSLLRPGVTLVTGSERNRRQLLDAEGDDLALCIDFPRYRSHVKDMADWMTHRNIEVASITDSPLSPLVAASTSWLAIDVGASGPFDSSIAAVAVVEELLVAVANRSRKDGELRLRMAESLWAMRGEFI